MGQRIITGCEEGTTKEVSLLFDSVTGWAFGPVFDERDGISGADRLLSFLEWCGETIGERDLRGSTPLEVEDLHSRWLVATGQV